MSLHKYIQILLLKQLFGYYKLSHQRYLVQTGNHVCQSTDQFSSINSIIEFRTKQSDYVKIQANKDCQLKERRVKR